MGAFSKVKICNHVRAKVSFEIYKICANGRAIRVFATGVIPCGHCECIDLHCIFGGCREKFYVKANVKCGKDSRSSVFSYDPRSCKTLNLDLIGIAKCNEFICRC